MIDTNATISIGRTTTNEYDGMPLDYMNIEIWVNGTRHKVSMTMENFAMAITGRAKVPCQHGVINTKGK